MALGTPTIVGSGSSDTDAASYPANGNVAMNFVSGRDYFIGVLNTHSATVTPLTSVSGATSGTWTAPTGTPTATFNTIASPGDRVTVRMFHATSTFSEVITIDFGGTTQTGCQHVVVEISGVHATPVLQCLASKHDTVSAESVAMAAFAANSLGLGFAAVSAQRTYTAANSYTLLGSVLQGSAPVTSLQALYKMSQGDPGVTWTTNTNSGIVGLEIQASTGLNAVTAEALGLAPLTGIY